MDLKQISNNELILRMEKLVRTERKITHLVLLHIAEIEERKLYAEIGYDGMYAYLTRGLGYSEGSAYRRLQSARLLKQVPSVARKIEEGHLNLTQLSQVQKCLKDSAKTGEKVSKEKTLDVLSKIENKNSWETQKTLALEMDLPVVVHEKIQPQKNDSVRLEITLTQEQFAALETARNLLSHVCPDGNWSEVIAILAKKFNHKKIQMSDSMFDSVSDSDSDSDSDKNTSSKKETLPLEIQKLNRKKDLSNQNLPQPAIATKSKNKQTSNEGLSSLLLAVSKNAYPSRTKKTSRKYISIHHQRFLLKKAHHHCEYQDPKTGRRCTSQYQLEIDHRQPLAFGGSNDLPNLRILCRSHNVLAAKNAGLKINKPATRACFTPGLGSGKLP